MVQHQSDVTEVEYPDHYDDRGEVFDLVVRKGPITHKGLMDQIGVYSSDQVSRWLFAMEEDGHVERVEGDLEEHGTTRDVWYVPVE